MLNYLELLGEVKCTFLMLLLEIFKLHIWLPFYFFWTILGCRKDAVVYRMSLIKSSLFFFFFAVAT